MELPPQAHSELQAIDKELADGDITQQGHEKKRSAILQKYGTVKVSREDLSAQLGNILLHPAKPKLTKMQGAEIIPTPPLPISNMKAFDSRPSASSNKSSSSKKDSLQAMTMRLRDTSANHLPPPIVPRRNLAVVDDDDEEEDLATVQKLIVKQLATGKNFDDSTESAEPTVTQASPPQTQTSKAPESFVLPKDPLSKYGTISRKLGNLKAGLNRPKIARSHNQLSEQPEQKSSAVGRKLTCSVKDSVLDDMSIYVSVAQVLRARDQQSPKQVAQQVVDHKGRAISSITYEKLCARAEKCCQVLQEKYGLKYGDKAILIFRKIEVIEFTVALLGCSLAGVVAVPAVSVPCVDQLNDIQTLLMLTGAQVVLSSEPDMHQLNKEFQARKQDWPQVKFCMVDDIGEYKASKKNELKVKQPLPQDICYIEYTRDIFGQLKGVCMTNASVVTSCLNYKALNQLQPKDVIMSTLEFRQQFGLVYGTLLSVYSGTMFVSLMPGTNLSLNVWASTVKKFHATFCLADSKLLRSITSEAQAIPQDLIKKLPKQDAGSSLLTLRAIVVADLPPVVRFDAMLQKLVIDSLTILKLPKDCNITSVCQAAEVGGLCVASRTFEDKTVEPQNIWLAQDKLRCNVLEVQDSKTADDSVQLTDCGWILPGLSVVIVDQESQHQCQGVGELWLQSLSFPTHFSSDAVQTSQTFQAILDDKQYCRTGVLGFLHNQRVYVAGCLGEVLVTVNFDGQKLQHFSADINKFVQQSCYFVEDATAVSITLNDEDLAIVVIEASKIPNKEQLQKEVITLWNKLKSQLQFIAYSILVCPVSEMPRSKDGNVSIEHTRKRYDVGLLNISYILIKSADALRSLPVSVDPSTEEYQNSPDNLAESFHQTHQQDLYICDGSKAGSHGRGCGTIDAVAKLNLTEFESLSKLLIWRARNNANLQALTAVDAKAKVLKTVSFAKLSEKVSRVALYLDKKVQSDHTVMLLYHNCIDYVVAVHACLYLGIAMVIFDPSLLIQDGQNTNVLLDVLKAYNIDFLLCNEESHDILKVKPVASLLKGKPLPEVIITSKAPKVANKYMEDSQDKSLDVLLPVTLIQMTGEQSYAAMTLSHDTLIAQCAFVKELSAISKAPLFSAGDVYQGIGFIYATVLGVYTGAPTMILSSQELVSSPYAWMEVISKNQVKDCSVSQSVLTATLKQFNFDKDHRSLIHLDLSPTHNIQVIINDRPETSVVTKFGKKFHKIGVEQDVINYTLSTVVNPLVACRSYLYTDPVELYLKLKPLHKNKVELGSKDDFNCVRVVDCGRVLPSSYVTIAQPGTVDVCQYGDIGEILVCSNANYDATTIHSIFSGGKIVENVAYDVEIPLFPDLQFARTGLIGFLQKTSIPNFTTQTPIEDYVIFVLGQLKDQICYDVIYHGRRLTLSYFAADLEQSIEKSCPSIPKDGCIVFKTQVDQQPVFNVIAELIDAKNAELRSIPIIVNALIDDHQLIPGNLTFVKPGSLPKGSHGLKLRWSTQTAFEQGKLQVVGHHRL